MRLYHSLGFLSAVLLVACSAQDSQESDLQMRETTAVSRMAESTPPTLDGRTYEVDMGETGSEETGKDTLTFSEGSFHSAGCDQYGFSAAPYTASADGESIAFSSTTRSDTNGVMAWTGRVAGDQLEGEVTWSKDGQDPILYQISGTAQ